MKPIPTAAFYLVLWSLSAPVVAQSGGYDFTDDPDTGTVRSEDGYDFTKDEPDAAPKIDNGAPLENTCGNRAQLLKVISGAGQLTMAAGPANVTYSGPDGPRSYKDSTVFKGPAELAFVQSSGKFIFWSKNAVLFIPNLELNLARGTKVSPEWQKVFSNPDYQGINPQDLMDATGCYDMLELFGAGQGTISRHGGFGVSIRLRLAFSPDTAGDFVGSMIMDGADDEGKVVHYEVPVSLSR